ncbi:sensor histidine kinase [Streptomyces sp. H10-C2]|uniref:ATP-binding protein n=1 Tax=unclassified Streptomyces TaxID=2593676 RepID=UPI0024B93450|nr:MULTISPECIES: sensor histidine kinase [unclassified Streptomyces]MDJ0340979.1 sensor histidine kinase [Streptomyces sp. PH10-H1]MDJ0369789.1 sensor histidine kinase [Streptomyces sp. H10-C2]
MPLREQNPSQRGNRKLSTRILIGQLAILGVTSAIGFVLLAFAQRAQLDRQYEQRALAIAHTTAADPQIQQAMEYGGGNGVVQTIAQRIRAASDASYVVVIDLHGIRHSHPHPDLIGKRVEEPIMALDTKDHAGIDQGATGRSANGKAPLYGPTGTLVGEVSVGLRDKEIIGELKRELPTFGLFAGMALALGSVASYVLARRLKRSTFGLELEEISGLLQDREAMLHGIREGVVAFDPYGRITVVNDEARRLLGLGTALGSRLREVIPDGRLRRALDGSLSGVDLTVLTDSHCLAINRMPVVLHGQELGAVVTVRDRTELVGLLRELDSVRGLTDALRAQQHEFSNRMHTLAGLLEMGECEAALEYVVGSAVSEPALAESVRERIGNALMVGLIVAKTTVAAERGVRIELSDDSALCEQPPHLRRLLTIVGNLLDNAVDAAASGSSAATGPEVRLVLIEADSAVLVSVGDTGPGIPPGAAESIFEDGWSTRPDRGTARRGLGLALVHRLVQRHGGSITVTEGPGASFTVLLPLPDTDPAPLSEVFTVGAGMAAGVGPGMDAGTVTSVGPATGTGAVTGAGAVTRVRTGERQ